MSESEVGPGEPGTDEGQYVVRLLMSVNAGSPEEAVVMFVNRLIEHGMRNWVYAALDADTNEVVGSYNGWGEDMTEQIVAMSGETPSTPAPPPSEPIEAHLTDDDDLLELAEQLNRES